MLTSFLASITAPFSTSGSTRSRDFVLTDFVLTATCSGVFPCGITTREEKIYDTCPCNQTQRGDYIVILDGRVGPEVEQPQGHVAVTLANSDGQCGLAFLLTRDTEEQTQQPRIGTI